jgi:AhpD family alkylhydroperoxidase
MSSDERSREEPTTSAARIPPGGFRELGVVNWAFCKLAARVLRVPQVHIFATLGQHKRLFWAWLPFGAIMLALGKLPRRDTELVILRVGHLRGCEYELQQHRRIAKQRGLDAETQAKIFEGPRAEGLTDRQRALLTGIGELIDGRTLSDQTWTQLQAHLDRAQLIEFITLIGQYDALAATLVALRVPMDYAD